ncbi:MAG TPA: SEC-C metal-binding domain-containing protein [Acidimicrobiia bacterium]|nr:SEC-C metal-binding domain-containing protein [Acidimicrobiia bacterium]
MGIDRGTLSRIDRKLLAGLDTDEEWRVARLPVSEALWSAWKRYCSAIGISMGRGIAALIQRELEAVIGAKVDVDLLSETEAELRSRERAVDDQERLLLEREQSLMKRERLLSLAGHSRVPASNQNVGRNERCPCGSGLKYKRCHGR